MESISRRTVMLGTLGVAGAAVVGCSSQPPGEAGTTPAAPSSPTPTADTTPRWPLTGVPLAAGDDPKRVVVAVKVPDNQNEHPQKGINDADIVYVELDGYPAIVGQSSTRLVPVFHSRYASDAAPVRSLRPVDVPMLSPMTAIIGSTGGAPWTVAYFKKFTKYLISNWTNNASSGTGAYSIDRARVRTYKGTTYYDRAVVCHPPKLAKLAKKFTDGPQQPYFPWAATDAEVSTVNGESCSKITIPWKSGNTYPNTYTWNAGKGVYLRSEPFGPHVLADGTRVTTDNVMVILAKQSFEHHEPFHAITKGTGTFYYAHGGKAVTGTWTKGDVNETFQFTLADGTPLKMAPGRTFIELPNKGAKITIKA